MDATTPSLPTDDTAGPGATGVQVCLVNSFSPHRFYSEPIRIHPRFVALEYQKSCSDSRRGAFSHPASLALAYHSPPTRFRVFLCSFTKNRRLPPKVICRLRLRGFFRNLWSTPSSRGSSHRGSATSPAWFPSSSSISFSFARTTRRRATFDSSFRLRHYQCIAFSQRKTTFRL